MSSYFSITNFINNISEKIPIFHGAIDVIITRQPDGSFKSGPFHVRFGKMTAVNPYGKTVDITLNGKLVENLHMRLGKAGDGYFVDSSDVQYDSDIESNISSDSPPTSPITRSKSFEELSYNTFKRTHSYSESKDFGSEPLEELRLVNETSSLTDLNPKSLSDDESATVEKDRYFDKFIWEWGKFPKKSHQTCDSKYKLERRKSDAPNIETENIKEKGVLLEDIAQADESIKQNYIYPPSYSMSDSNLIDAGYKSDGEVPNEFQENPLDIKLSLCGKLDGNSLPTREDFYEKLVTYQEFRQDPVKILNNPNLVILYKSKYYNWNVGAALIMSMICFREELSSHITKKIEDDYMPKKKSSRKTWFGSWYHFDEQTASTSKNPQLKITVAENVLIPPMEERKRKRNRLKNEEIQKLDLKAGKNEIQFSITTQYQGKTVCTAHIFFWQWSDKIIVSDVDGTITRSDVMGQVLPVFGRDWTQKGIAKLYSRIADSGYKFIYVSSRAIAQSSFTRQYVTSVRQDEYKLPDGPILLSPNSLFHSINLELIQKSPEFFKIECLEDVKMLFDCPENDSCPLFAGFGNKINDVRAYSTAGIDSTRIFTVNHTGEVKNEFLKYISTTYDQMFSLADHYFPIIEKDKPELNSLCLNLRGDNYSKNNDSLSNVESEKQSVVQTPCVSRKASTADLKNYTSFSYWRNPLTEEHVIEDLHKQFEEAAKIVEQLYGKLKKDELLYLYARFKQANFGDCNTSCPPLYEFSNRAKWNAWNEIKGMSKEDAMKQYVEAVKANLPSYHNDHSPIHESDGLGIRVSTLVMLFADNMAEVDSSLDSSIIPFARDGQLDNIKQLMQTANNNIESVREKFIQKDFHGLTALHWAVDRNRSDVVSFLLEKCPQNWFAINQKDDEGQTPLHYASMAGNIKMCELLLSFNADKDIQDNDGQKPLDLTDCDKCKELLR